ncbi:MAG: TrmH family RNA methyltransferase [Ilumatobacteraceae bacterium]
MRPDQRTVTVETADDSRLAEFSNLRHRPAGGPTGRVAIVESQPVIERLVGSRFVPQSFLLSRRRADSMSNTLAAFPDAIVYVADDAVLEQVVGFDLHRGALAACPLPAEPDEAALYATSRRIVVLEGSNDPENIGAIARSARALGIDALVLNPTCATAYSRRAIRVSMGELLHLPVLHAADWPAPIARLHDHGFDTWALTPNRKADSIFDLAPPLRVALIAGAEGPGLTETALSAATRRVRIPLRDDVDSLNLGHALAIAIAHVGAHEPRTP